MCYKMNTFSEHFIESLDFLYNRVANSRRKYRESTEADRCPNDERFGKKKTTVDKFRPGIVCANRSWKIQDPEQYMSHETRVLSTRVSICVRTRSPETTWFIDPAIGQSTLTTCSVILNRLFLTLWPLLSLSCFHLLSSTRATTYYHCVKASRYTRRYRWTLVELQRIARNVVSSIFPLCFFYRQRTKFVMTLVKSIAVFFFTKFDANLCFC